MPPEKGGKTQFTFRDPMTKLTDERYSEAPAKRNIRFTFTFIVAR